MVRVIIFRITDGVSRLASDLSKHAAEGYWPQVATYIPSQDGGIVLYVLVQVMDQKPTEIAPTEIIPTTEIPLGAQPSPSPGGNGGSHA